MVSVLSTTYFGPVQWYQKVNRADEVWIEACESFVKQTYRNRCIIATTNGLQALTIPVSHDEGRGIRQMRISNHGNWRHLHWNALASAYGESPFFDYYEDDLRPFFEEEWEYLFDYNLAITRKMLQLLDVRKEIRLTERWSPASQSLQERTRGEDCGVKESMTVVDYRDAIRPKNPAVDADFIPRRYYQVYEQKHGFQPNLSILDLLFNMGNEAILYL